MPLPLLFALFLAFGFDTPVFPGSAPGPLPRLETWTRSAEAALGLASVAVVSFALGKLVTWRVSRRGRASSRTRRAYAIGVRAVDLLSVAVFGWIVHGLDWPRVVRSGFGLGDPILLDDALILLPFVLAQLAGWWGVYAGERALRPSLGPVSVRRYLWLKTRQSLGMVLPVAGLYALGSDLVHRNWPATTVSPWDQPLSLAAMGVLVLVLAPAFVRLAWPTRPLPPGPLRNRLEHLAHRVGFRFTDILVWDTDQVIVNAGVTGSLPRFRYVLLTDALIENLNPYEIAAVFGHEVGHVAHRHLVYFGFFIIGSLGVLAFGLPSLQDQLPAWVSERSTAALVAQALGTLLVMALYFLAVFGFVSRRFERQADVFGCKAVSCDRQDCPPTHADLDSRPSATTGRPSTIPLCPVGIRTFINALSNVAMLNGMRPEAWSWRHGSIARRIRFLEGLVDAPDAERQFQRGVVRMRRGVAAALVTAVVVLAWATNHWQGP